MPSIRRILLVPALLALSPSSRAEAPAPASSAAVLETVVVTGDQPGPGLWRVRKGEHELWILGTLSPLPKRMRWAADEVEATIARAGEVIAPPRGGVTIKGGAIRGLFLIPSALGARNNPDKATLDEVLPPELYARWSELKARYLPRSRSVEKRRPIFAAFRLYQKALDRADLALDDVIEPVVKKARRRHDVPLTTPEVTIRIEDPGKALKEFKGTTLDDVECFRRTLDQVENDLDTLAARGNAWATGGLEALQALPYTDPTRSCIDAFAQAAVLQERGFDDIEQRLEKAWLDAVEAAMAKHRVSFAMLPIGVLFRSEGWLAELRARGYEVEEPWVREARELGLDATTPDQ